MNSAIQVNTSVNTRWALRVLLLVLEDLTAQVVVGCQHFVRQFLLKRRDTSQGVRNSNSNSNCLHHHSPRLSRGMCRAFVTISQSLLARTCTAPSAPTVGPSVIRAHVCPSAANTGSLIISMLLMFSETGGEGGKLPYGASEGILQHLGTSQRAVACEDIETDRIKIIHFFRFSFHLIGQIRPFQI